MIEIEEHDYTDNCSMCQQIEWLGSQTRSLKDINDQEDYRGSRCSHCGHRKDQHYKNTPGCAVNDVILGDCPCVSLFESGER